MKKLLMLLFVAAIFAACEKIDPVAELDDNQDLKSSELVGNHFNLNIIGVDGEKEMTNVDNGNVIFVPLYGRCDILLQQAADFENIAVIDKDGTDGDAKFQLPAPFDDPYVIGADLSPNTTYSVWVRALGSPKDEPFANIVTCADLLDDEALMDLVPNKDANQLEKIMNATTDGPTDGVEYFVSMEQIPQELTTRTKGKSLWSNVTAELTSVVFEIMVWVDTDASGDYTDGEEIWTYYVRVPIFDELLGETFWKYDNNGLKLLQVRLYPTGTDLTEADQSWQPIEY